MVKILEKKTEIVGVGLAAYVIVTLILSGLSGEGELTYSRPEYATCDLASCFIDYNISNGYPSAISISTDGITAADSGRLISSPKALKQEITEITTDTYGDVEKSFKCDYMVKATSLSANATKTCVQTAAKKEVVLFNQSYKSYDGKTKTFIYDSYEKTGERQVTSVAYVEDSLTLQPGEWRVFRLNFDVPMGSSGKFNTTLCFTVEGEEVCDVDDPWWNASWSYKQEINIYNQDVSKTGFEVLLQLNSTYVGEHFEWDNNGTDLRFINSTGDQLYAWNHTWDNETETAKIWVRTNLVASDNTTIYMYYGNSMASEAFSKEDTMAYAELFDEDPLYSTWDASSYYYAWEDMYNEIPVNVSFVMTFDAQTTKYEAYSFGSYQDVYPQHNTGTAPYGYADFQKNGRDAVNDDTNVLGGAVSFGKLGTNRFNFTVIWNQSDTKQYTYKNDTLIGTADNTTPFGATVNNFTMRIYYCGAGDCFEYDGTNKRYNILGDHNGHELDSWYDNIIIRQYAFPALILYYGDEEENIGGAPTVTWNWTVNQTSTYPTELNITVRTDVAYDTCLLEINGTTNVTMLEVNNTYAYYNYTPLAGNHTYIAYCNDSAGWGKTYEVWYNIIEPPFTITITSAQNTTITQLWHVFNVTLSDEGNCTLNLDGSEYINTSSALELTWNKTLTETNHTDIYFNCTNGTTTNQTPTYWLNVDATGPTITIVSTENTTLTTTSHTFNITKDENSNCSVYLDSAWETMTGTALVSTYAATLSQGNHTGIYFRCEDPYGNTGESYDYWLNVDSIAPGITINSAENVTLTTTSHTFNITLDETGNCSLNLDAVWYANSTIGTEITWAKTLPQGNSSGIYFRCEDIYGNTGNSYDYWLNVDSVAPVVTFGSWYGLNTTILDSSTTVTWTVSETAKNCTLNFNGTTYDNTTQGTSYEQEVTGLAVGNYSTINVTCYDLATNVGITYNAWTKISAIYEIDVHINAGIASSIVMPITSYTQNNVTPENQTTSDGIFEVTNNLTSAITGLFIKTNETINTCLTPYLDTTGSLNTTSRVKVTDTYTFFALPLAPAASHDLWFALYLYFCPGGDLDFDFTFKAVV